MGFMQHQVTNKRTWVEIDGTHGTTFVDAEDASEVLAALEARADANDDEDEEAIELAETYYDGTVQTVTLREGYGARLSAPGYLDCTDWSVYATAEEAEAALQEQYDGDDEDDEE